MNILVVDDQPDVVTGIVENICWKKFKTDQVFSAYSAGEAREILCTETIDILLCDIEMPKENGMELVSWIRAQGLPVECLFLTSHAEFDYAQEALRLGSFDYILQPAPYAEIEAALSKLMKKISANQQLERLKKVQQYENELADRMADGLLVEILENENCNAGSLTRIIELKLGKQIPVKNLGIALLQVIKSPDDMDTHLISVAISHMLQQIFSNYGLYAITLKRHAFEYVVLVPGTDLKQNIFYEGLKLYHTQETDFCGFRSALYLGNIVRPEIFFDEIKRLILFSRNNVMQKPEIFMYSDVLTSDMEISLSELRINRWEYYLENGRGSQIVEMISDYFSSNSFPDSEAHKILETLFWKFNSALVSMAHKKNLEYRGLFDKDSFTFDKYMESYKTYEQFLSALEHIVSLLSDSFSDFRNTEPAEEDVAAKVIRYIDENLSQNPSRAEIAEHVHLNEDYLTRIFKKKTGYSLKDYIMKEKINLAKELLGNTNISISLIALKAGFTNFSHFSYTFKKLEGITPNEYRAKHQKTDSGILTKPDIPHREPYL